MGKIQAVIFDMDGTLYDTEAVYGMAWMHAGLSRQQYFQMIGRSQSVNDATLQSWGFDPEATRRRRDIFIADWLGKNGLPVKPGAEEALRWLREQGIPTAVATSSPLAVAQKYLEVSGFGPFFDRVLSGYELEHGKPEPDLFLLAAEELGTGPAQCLVAEDSFNGVRAGKRAGMITVMIPDCIEPDEEMHRLADGILNSLSELPDFIRNLSAS